MLGGGSTKSTPTPATPSPIPTEEEESVQAAAETERRRIASMTGRKKTILSYGQLDKKPSILKAKLGQA